MEFNQIFKAYDVRGIFPDQINAEVVARIGEAYAVVRQPGKIAIGQDVRASGEELKERLIKTLLACGIDVVDIGVITTDQLYFAVGQYGYDGGISITASHNPGEYNGLKFSEKGGAPITSEMLTAIRDWAASENKPVPSKKGELSSQEILDDYVNHVLSYIEVSKIKPLKVVANANFGAVGRAVDKIAGKLDLQLERLNWQEDGSFPKGPPNPLLPENREETVALIRDKDVDLGVSWDADADRCFMFAGDGTFIPSAYIIALLAPEFLKRFPGSKIVHDVTAAWVMDDAIKSAGGIPVMNRTGHTFMKARMRQEDAPFSGESSGHYYFRDSFYADNGLIPFLMILQLISDTGKSLKELVSPLMDRYKISGEINFTVADPAKAIEQVESEFAPQGRVDKTDGLVVETDKWRFSVRPSNTEPLFRLNAEAHSQAELDSLVKRISELISSGR
jgi:phosphomannomutase